MTVPDLFGKVVRRAQDGSFFPALIKRMRWVFRGRAARYLDRARGVVHVGANTGQGCETYALLGLPVIWIEPIPEIFEKLERNIAPYGNQRAVRALITDQDGRMYRFNVASNGGGSSSILELDKHRDIWPGVHFEKSIELESSTLAKIFEQENIDPSLHDLLVLDTQGSELMVLRGARELLDGFNQIMTEAADFSAYSGGCQLRDIVEFLAGRGFREVSRDKFARHPTGGAYYNVLFERSR